MAAVDVDDGDDASISSFNFSLLVCQSMCVAIVEL